MASPLPVHPILGPTPFPIHVADSANPWLTYVFPTIGTLAAVVAAIAAIVALRGLVAANETLRLMKAQAQAADSERAAREAERAKKPRLVVYEERTTYDEHGVAHTRVPTVRAMNNAMPSIRIRNDGDRPATNINVDFLIDGIKDVGLSDATTIALSPGGITATKKYVGGDLAPGDWRLVGPINGATNQQTCMIKWMAHCNEGVFPVTADGWGILPIEFFPAY